MSAPTAEETSWPELHRERRALVVVDVVESVRLMQAHEADVIDRWRRFVNEVRTQVLPAHGGRLVKSLGDGMLLEFENVPAAVASALDLQGRIERFNAGYPSAQSILLRTGIHCGEVVIDDLDVHGVAVNLTARLAGAAQPGEILLSNEARDRVVGGIDAEVEDLGEHYLKHVDTPVRAWRVGPPPDVPAWSASTAAVGSLRPVLAIIPFEIGNSADAPKMVGDALADEAISALSRNPELSLISRLSTKGLRGRSNLLAMARQHLKADYVLTGHLYLSGDRARLVAELVEASSAKVVWAGVSTGSLRGVFAGADPMMSELAQKVSQALSKRQVERARTQPFATLESFCLLMAAISLLHATSHADFNRSRALLEHLIDRDRRHPAPYAWLANWHVMLVQQGWSTDRARDRQLALDFSARALDLDPGSSLSLAIAGFVYCNLDKRFDEAQACLEMALNENPSEPLAWLFLGNLHAFKGDGAEALNAADRALELSPLDPMRYFFESLASTAALSAGQWERAIERSRHSLRLHRTHTSTLRVMTIAQVQLGRLDEARATARSLRELEPLLTIRDYLARTPANGFATGKLWSESLAIAGIPAE